MASFFVRRLLLGLTTLAAVSVLIFVATAILPGDAARAVLGRNATPESLAAMREQLGLDRPIIEQYLQWVRGVVTGEMGTSVSSGVPVSDVIAPRVSNSLTLGVIAAIILIPLPIILGTVAGIRAGGSVDKLVSIPSLILGSLPEFVVGSFVILLLSLRLGWFPPVSIVPPGESALQHLDALVLPILALVIVGVGYTSRVVRAGVIEGLQSDFVETARLKGVPEGRVIRRHVLPNSLAAAIHATTVTLQWLIGGLIIIEVVFGYPGVGSVLVQAVSARDIPLVQATTLFIAAVFIALNVVADTLIVLATPKLRTGA